MIAPGVSLSLTAEFAANGVEELNIQRIDLTVVHAQDGDAVLMIEDGVYGGLDGTGLTEIISDKTKTVSLYVLSPDLSARGVPSDRLIAGVEGVDYSGFVDLVAKHDRTQAWL